MISTARRLPNWAGRLGLLGAGTAFAIGVVEVLLRVFGSYEPNLYQPDEACGWRLTPNVQTVWTKEGFSHITINSMGFRDREHSLEKPAGAIRIAVLGDSYIEALQVPLEDSFIMRLERELARRTERHGPHVEVLGFGVSGWGTAQQLQALRTHVWQYEPDVVLLAFLSANDVRNNSAALEPDRNRPFFRLHGSELQLDTRFREQLVHPRTRWERAKEALVDTSRVVYVARAAWRDWKAHGTVARQAEALEAGRRPGQAVGREAGLDDGSFRQPVDSDWAEAWEVTERILRDMRDEVREHSAEFVVLCVTSSAQVHPDPERRRRAAEHLGVSDLDYGERRIVAWGARHRVPVIPLAEAFREIATARGQSLHGFSNAAGGHWNATGHAQAARIAADRLAPVLGL